MAVTQDMGQANRERRRRALVKASRDPLFLADMEEVERDFARADAEAGREAETALMGATARERKP